MELKLVTLQDGQVKVDGNASRALMRSAGLKFQEVDIETGSPREFQRKFATAVQDAGYAIVEDTINMNKGAIGAGVGDVKCVLVARRDEEEPAALRFRSRPYTVTGIILGTVLLAMTCLIFVCGFTSLAFDESGTTGALITLLSVGVGLLGLLSFGLPLIRKTDLAPMTRTTVLRVRAEGEAYETMTEMEVAAGRQVKRALITARLAVAISTEVVFAFDPKRVPSRHMEALRTDATMFVTAEGARGIEGARQRAVAEMGEFADRIRKLSEVA